MKNSDLFRRILLLILLIGLVVVFSYITNKVWGSPEENSKHEKLIISNKMTIIEFGYLNKIPKTVLFDIFGLKRDWDTNKSISSLVFNRSEILKRTKVASADYEEEHSKNPIRYTIHFILAILFMAFAFYLIRNSKINSSLRLILYFISIVIFGFGFNSSPSPMGPVKDTISLFGNISEILHPRLFAIMTYLIIGIIANKFMCSWICQFGVLQDFIFRLFRKVKGKKQIVKQYKIPFIISNSIRVIFITITSIVSVFWAVNIIDTLNPFNIFNPTELKLFGLIFILSIVVMSIFVYRPWCSLFCPYGLLSWLFEKFSVYKIKVDYQTCTSCNECVKSCPSDAMKAILGKYYTIPDCFSCGTCINSCPSNSIKFGKSYKNFSHSKTPDTV